MDSKKIKYNKNQAKRYGWTPEWFGHDKFDEKLIENIQEFQREHGLSDDGMCGPSTYRRAWTEREADGEYGEIPDGPKNIIHNGNLYPIKWDKVVLWNQPGGLTSGKGYSSYAGKTDRKPKFFVNHWDVCLSAKSCAKVLKKRGISIHFCIDNDGTIYQLLDTQHAAWQAGRGWNRHSIGVEISNAYYLKYSKYYEKNWGPRPVWKDKKVHGKTLKPFLGFYDVQIEALAALWEAIHNSTGIPLEIPGGKDAYNRKVAGNKFKGFVCHYHLTKGKIDCAGLDLEKVLQKAKMLRLKS